MFPVQPAQQWSSLYDFEWAVRRLYCQLCSGLTIALAAAALAAAALTLTATAITAALSTVDSFALSLDTILCYARYVHSSWSICDAHGNTNLMAAGIF